MIHLAGYGATAHLESGGFIRSCPGVTHPDIQFHFLPSQVIDHGRVMPKLEAYQVRLLWISAWLQFVEEMASILVFCFNQSHLH